MYFDTKSYLKSNHIHTVKLVFIKHIDIRLTFFYFMCIFFYFMCIFLLLNKNSFKKYKVRFFKFNPSLIIKLKVFHNCNIFLFIYNFFKSDAL